MSVDWQSTSWTCMRQIATVNYSCQPRIGAPTGRSNLLESPHCTGLHSIPTHGSQTILAEYYHRASRDMALRPPMRHLSRHSSAQNALSPQHSATRCFSVLSRPTPSYPNHVPLALFERGMLAIGSALGSIISPGRHGKLPLEIFHSYFFRSTCTKTCQSNVAQTL